MSNINKSNESNAKRLESLQKVRDEYNLKRKLISSSLKELDSKQVKNKKIIFDDDDADDCNEDVTNKSVSNLQYKENESSFSNQINKKKNEKLKDNNKSSKKLLMSSSGESDSESEENTKKMFESKINLKEKEANQLIYLKSKYSNEDSRFKIDDRFIEEESSESESDSSEDEEENEIIKKKEEDDEKDEGEPVEKNVIGKKKIKNENIKSLKILEEITGKTIKPQSLSTSKDKSNKQQTDSTKPEQIVRYDPTKDEHKKFEINNETSDSDSSSDEDEKKLDKNNKDASSSNSNEQTVKVEDKSQFYQIDSNLKSLFSSSDVFKFKFTNENAEEMNKSDNKFGKAVEIKPTPFKFGELSNRFNSSSDEEDDELEEMEENEVEEMIESEDEKYEKEQMKINDKKITNGSLTNGKSKFNEKHKTSQSSVKITQFLPDLIESSIGKEILDYFKRKSDDLSELRKEWVSKREVLVQEYKKKHKRVLRIQKNKKNESLLSWKNSMPKKQ